MANQLKVELIADPQNADRAVRNFEKGVDQAEQRMRDFGRNAQFGEDITAQMERVQRETLALQRSFNRLHGPQGVFDPMSREAQRAQARAFQLQQELDRIQKLAMRGGAQTFLDDLAADALKAESAMKRLQKEELRLQIQSASRRPGSPGGGAGQPGSGSDVAGGIAGSLGIPLSGGLAAAAGTALFVNGVNQAIDKAREGADANRLLTASATEAGFSYDLAGEKAANFAAQTGLSGTQAKQTFSSLLQVANVARATEDIDSIQKRFADLAAARGVAAQDLSTLAQQILSGQDEALNRMGLADPSKLAANWAAAHGRTVESMTQSEQVASRLDAVMRKGAMFDGSAEERLRSVSGQMELTNQSLSNLTTGIGEGILANMEFRDLLSTINDALRAISTSSDEVRSKLAKGISPKDLANQEADTFGNVAFDVLKDRMTSPAAAFAAAFDLASGESLEVTMDRLNEAATGAHQRRRDALESQFNAEKQQIEAQKKAADEQRQVNEQKAKTEAEKIATQQAANERIRSLQVQIGRDDSLTSQIANVRLLKEEVQRFGAAGVLATTDVTQKVAALDEQLFQTNKRMAEIVRSTFKETRSFLDDMQQRVNKDNPFITLFSQADTVMERSRERFRAYGEDFVEQMSAIELKAIEMDKLALRIEQSQKVIGLQSEIRKLQFGPTGTSAEDERRLEIYSKRIAAARDIPGLEAQAQAVELGRLGSQGLMVDQGTILRRQIESILKLQTQFSGTTGYGDREARSRINQELISLFQGAGPQLQAQLIQRGRFGFREEIAGAYRGQAADRTQAIEDELRRAEAGRFEIERAQRELADLRRFGGFGNDEIRKRLLASTGSLSENELTPELRRARGDALQEQVRAEVNKERRAEERQRGVDALLKKIEAIISAKGIKLDQDGAGLLVEIKDESERATTSVTGRAFSSDPEQMRRDVQF